MELVGRRERRHVAGESLADRGVPCFVVDSRYPILVIRK
jgi:hypothetical protein